MELRLQKLHDPKRDFIIRCCMYVEDADYVVVGSVVRQCEECDRDIWYATNQKTPVVPGVVFEGEVLLCLPCVMMHQSLDPEPPKWVGPSPESLGL
jgi:hypothetical protein